MDECIIVGEGFDKKNVGKGCIKAY